MTTCVNLELMKLHNDERLHPQRPSMRVFRSAEGYRLSWYPPNIFCIECDFSEGDKLITVQRWFATTNVETWIVAGSADEAREAVEKCLGDNGCTDSPRLRKTRSPQGQND